MSCSVSLPLFVTLLLSGRRFYSVWVKGPWSPFCVRGLWWWKPLVALALSGTLLATDGAQPRARSPESADAAVGATGGVSASAGGIAWGVPEERVGCQRVVVRPQV